MAGLLSGLESLGLGNLENIGIFDKEKKEEKVVEKAPERKEPVFSEADVIYDKTFRCPVCESSFTSKIMRTGKGKLLRTDFDLRPVYEGFAAEKYDVLLCPKCGYAALGRYFPFMLPAQAKIIREKISSNIVLSSYDDPTYSFEQALERYKIALACSVVKRSKSSEKAYVCLRMAWLLRSYRECLETLEDDYKDLIDSLQSQEEEYEENAYRGFLDARGNEDPPIAGMDMATLDYLLAQLSFHLEDYSTCRRFVQSILGSSASNPRLKEKIKALNDQLSQMNTEDNA